MILFKTEDYRETIVSRDELRKLIPILEDLGNQGNTITQQCGGIKPHEGSILDVAWSKAVDAAIDKIVDSGLSAEQGRELIRRMSRGPEESPELSWPINTVAPGW
jgi:hypothetical protein